MSELEHPLDRYMRRGMIPHIWCEGCGAGIILTEFLLSLDELKYDINKVVVVSGIGCIGRISGYTNTDSFHTTHGRPLAFAVGVKAVRPDLKVVVISGDGDLFAIGGNHFIHAARRNIDVTVICSNNFNYGMTGGQSGPTTLLDAYTTTTPYGNIEHPFNLVHLAAAAGAVYVARWTTIHFRRLRDSIKKALQRRGFTFIDVISACPPQYGRRNRMREAMDMMKWMREKSVVQHFTDPSRAEVGPERIVVGEFVDIEKPEFTELLQEKTRATLEKLDKEGRLTNVTL
ncbi:MAG: thiamine pyrophosphate-dependent enzyme [Candidatus Geothermarchaeales archaeon]